MSSPLRSSAKEFFPKQKYRCKWGMYCHHSHCLYVHPYEKEYDETFFMSLQQPCKYQSESSACRLKCSSLSGRYCPFFHCLHSNKEVIQCTSQDCQGHCPSCI
jgi:hypothetical protein